MVIPKDVALPGQRLVTLPAAEMTRMPVLAHRLGVFSTLFVVVRQLVLFFDFGDGDFPLVGAFPPFRGGRLLHFTDFPLGKLHLHLDIRHFNANLIFGLQI